MKLTRLLTTTAAAMCLAATSVVAEAPNTQQQRSGAGAPDTMGTKMTVTGCVERAEQVVDRNTLGTSIDSQMFVLIKPAEPDSAAAAAAPTGTSGSAAAASGDRTMYWLNGTEDFNSHVGHKVEVTGTVANRAAGAVGTSGANNAAPSGTPSPSTPEPLRVETIKMVSSTCR